MKSLIELPPHTFYRLSITNRRLPTFCATVRRILDLRADGVSYRGVVAAMNAAAATDQRMRARGARWHLATVQRIVARCEAGEIAPAAAALAH